MSRLTIALICFSLITFITFSCKVKDRNQESTTEKISKKPGITWLLAGNEYKGWAIQSFTVNGEDKLKGLEPCQLDNVDFYHRNLLFESTEGLTKCNSDDPEIRRRGKWSLNADSTAIEVKLGTDLISLDLIEITEKKLHYRSDYKGQITEAILVVSDFRPTGSLQEDANR